ncbi:MAG: signal peptide peptidase SppA [Candidatus Diapherotrites archaeon]|nr:signal peptide peptidase SppA [Candidatus Diapherotrites archaeon]
MALKKNNDSKLLIFVLGALVVFVFLAFLLFFFFFGSGFNSGSIAVIPLKGEISSSESYSSFSSDEIADKINYACNDSIYSAIVLDIDSPGGEVVASKNIVYEVRDCNKPVVSYVGSTGASGAYYVAASSDFIFADADSITGSIGVISMIPNIEKLLENWGIEMNVIQAGKFKSMGSPFNELSEEERILFEELLNEVYTNFKSDILEFREGKITESELDLIADGRILSGRQALKMNLIDAIGTRKNAISKAAELSGIKGEPSVDFLNVKEFSLMDLFVSAGASFAEGFKTSLSASDNLKIYS